MESDLVHPTVDNFDAWELWGAISTCWNTSMAGLIGLDYASVKAVAEAMQIEWTEDLLNRIRLLEAETLQEAYKK